MTKTMVVDGCDNDRISELPDELIHHILSFLPTKDVVSMCILSKRWKSIPYSVPTLFFNDNHYTYYDDDHDKKFCNDVNNYLEQRKKAMHDLIVDNSSLTITSFKLETCWYYKLKKAVIIDKWLAFVIDNNKVKEIRLHIGPENFGKGIFESNYCLPKVIDNARYLTILELNSVGLDFSCSFNFPCLKTLILEDVWNSENAEEEVVVKFLLGCPSIEKLELTRYCFLGNNMNVCLESLSLKFLVLLYCKQEYDNDYLQIQVDAINLESLVLEGVLLDKIYFRRNHIFEALTSNIPPIENFTLKFCDTLKIEHLKISSQHLKFFHFEHFEHFEERNFNNCHLKSVTIESAPKLTYICYEGTPSFNISIKSHSSILNGKIVIDMFWNWKRNYDIEGFIDLMNILVNLSYSWNFVELYVGDDKELIWPENLPKNLKNLIRYPLVNWKHLRLNIHFKLKYESDLKETLMWISPSLESLSINKNVIF
ncbi:hypothetical protein CsatB_028274 [Cannabis sativa]